MFNFKFIKPYYPEVEILVLFNLSRSTLLRYREECLKNGGDLFLDMGYFNMTGVKSPMYEPYKLSNWLFENKVNVPHKYSYEFSEQHKLEEGLIVLADEKYAKLKSKVEQLEDHLKPNKKIVGEKLNA
jgi:hypothetical protein